jgi:hypothetical protein
MRKCLPWLFLLSFVLTLSHSLEGDYYSNYKCLLDPDEEEIVTGNLTIIDNRFAALSHGDLSKDLLWIMRGKKTSSYYENLINNVIVFTCQDSQYERCVPEDSDDAAKDENGACIIASDSSCEPGTCERKANCHWNDVQAGGNRTLRNPSITKLMAEKNLFDYRNGKSYIRQLLTPSIIGISVAIVLLLIWILYFIARYCCCCLWTTCSMCRLCSPIPREEGYRVCLHWVVPILCYVVGFLGIVLSGAIALVGNQDIDFALSESFEYVHQLLENFGIFLAQVMRPLNVIYNVIEEAAIEAFAIFRNTGFVKTSAEAIGDAFQYLGTDRDFAPGVAIIIQAINTASASFRSNIDPIVEDVESMLKTLEDGLYDNVDMIKSSLDSIIGGVTTFEDFQVAWSSNLTDFQELEREVRPYRLGGILSMFLIGGTVALVGLIGIISSRNRKLTKLHSMMNIAGVVSAFVATITFILASITLIVSFAWMDACEIEQIILTDLEPFLGKTAAQGASAIFNGENLTSAFNISDDLDFEGKLNKGLERIESVNISEQFSSLLVGFDQVDAGIEQISTSLFEAFQSILLQTNSSICPFNDDLYSIDYMNEPWSANENKTVTSWYVQTTGNQELYSRIGNETALDYFQRIYSVAGDCTENSANCCLNEQCFIGVGSKCNSGSGCDFDDYCRFSSSTIQDLAAEFLRFQYDSQNLGSDLGIYCHSTQCLTEAYQNAGFNESLIGMISSYGERIDETASSLVNLTSTSIGQVIAQVEKLLCKDISFVADGYQNVRDEVCTSMLGGFSQINWGLWMLAILLEFIAILINVLSTRLRGMTRHEANALTEVVTSWKGSTSSSNGSRHSLNRSSKSSKLVV